MKTNPLLASLNSKLNDKNLVVYLIAICAIARFFIYNCFQISASFPDSLTYEMAGKTLLEGRIDILRTPVYPLVIDFFKWLGGGYYLPLIVFFQSLLSLLSIYWFYAIGLRLLKSRILVVATTLLYGSYPSLVSFDLCLLTESFSISLCVLSFYLFLNLEKEPSNSRLIYLLLTILIGVLLRPAFLAIVIALLAVWLLKSVILNANKSHAVFGLIGLVGIGITLMAYSKLNQFQNGYYGISNVSNNNQLEIIIQNDLFGNTNDTSLSTFLKQNDIDLISSNHNDLIELVYQKYPQDRVALFIADCKANNRLLYFKRSFLRFVKLGGETTFVSIAKRKVGLLGKLTLGYSMFISIKFWFVYLVLFGFGVYLIRNWQSESNNFSWLLFWIYATVLLLGIVYESYGEYQRLFITGIPIIMLMTGKVFDEGIYKSYRKD